MKIAPRPILFLILSICAALGMAGEAEAVTLIEAGQPKATVFLEAGALTPAQQTDLSRTRQWLIEALASASGARLSIAAETAKAADSTAPALILTTREANPEIAGKAGLKTGNPDACAVLADGERLYLIGAIPSAIRYAAAQLLRDLGFRFYAPSPRWHVTPRLRDVRVEKSASEAPAIGSRSIWYAYGMPDKALKENYDQWVFGNRLTANPRINTGHSYGHIIGRNLKEFEAHPEYYALQESGERDSKRAVNARKFCYSNPGLIDLVARDRIQLLAELRKTDPLEYMVSVDPSDGEGTCHCPNCAKLGTTTDRVVSLANEVARRLRAVAPEAWVGLYAYSSHRLPPSIALEPNVYVQVALAFNRTPYSLPELVELWSKKAGAVGLREYYGVEAWDWGLPGRGRGGKVDYHRQWIPYYAERKLTSLNAETNANWAAQTPGQYIASELMWNTRADVDVLLARYFEDCFGAAAAPMKALHAKCQSGVQLNPASLSAMFGDVEKARGLTSDPAVQARLHDMMAYLLYVDEYRRFELVQDSQPSRNDVYYEGLKQLMSYAWRIRERDIVHYYALARRLANGLPLQDKRPEFWVGSKDKQPIWMAGDALTDAEIAAKFAERSKALAEDKTPYTTYSRFLEKVNPAGADAGASRALPNDGKGLAHIRGSLTGYLVATGQQRVTLGVKPVSKPVTLRAFVRGEELLTSATIDNSAEFSMVRIDLPKAGEYRFVLEGEALLQMPEDAPLAYEASVSQPAWIDMSGPFYFYVPRGVRQIFVNGEPRLSLFIPGVKARRDVTPADRQPGQSYVAIDVPEGADGQVWQTDPQTRGTVSFLNLPPLLSANRKLILIPREVAEADGLTTAP